MKTILHGCNNLLAAYQKDFPALRMQINFLSSQGLGSLNRLFALCCLKNMREGKDNSDVVMVFSFIALFQDRTMKNFQNPGLTKFTH